MTSIRLLQHNPDGGIVFRETTSSDVPAYAILSHTWGKEEITFQDIEAGAYMGKAVRKAGWEKIQFCAKQAVADGLQYFWIDTCCIDKKNAVELGAAINSMFRWYQNAARCYVYLADVAKTKEMDSEETWKKAFRTSRWFSRGWTLQELIAPRLVDFFSLEGERLGNKLSLEPEIHNITGIARAALRGDTLSSFSTRERRSWAEHRNTTIEEDKAYCLIGIFNISMVPNYGEGQDKAFRRLEEEIHRSYKGVDFEQYAIKLNLASIPEAAQFVARERELLNMQELLYGHSSRSIIVIHGLGGIGKTQLAVEYVRRYQEKYTAVFWLNANDEDSLRLSFRAIAQLILKYHPSTAVLRNIDLEGDLVQVVNAVKSWLGHRDNTSWLMIYDNYDNPRTSSYSDPSTVDLRQYLPGSDQGSVIITTRSANVTLGQRLHVQKLTGLEDGLKILSNTSRRGNIEHDPDARALVVKLDGLPLALSTAGAYLEHVTTSFADYLRLYEVSWSKLQRTSPRLNSYEDRSLYTTWQVTFDRIRKQNPASAQLLKLWAYFDKQDLWFGLLQHAHSADDEWIQQLTEDELSFHEAVRLLCEYGLAHPEASSSQQSGSAGYGMHSCVHSWTMSVLNDGWDDKLSKLALACVASAVPEKSADKWWLIQRRLLQHATRHDQSIIKGMVDVTGMEWAVYNLGNLYADQGKLVEAEKMYKRALRGEEESLGPNHTSTLDMVNNLGILYVKQGKLVEAEKVYERALRGNEEAFGLNHTSTLATVNNLGILYVSQGKLAEAEKMYERALQGYEEAFGLNHTSTLATVNNLGILYVSQGKLAEAEKMYERALQGYEEALGFHHTSKLDTVNNLGNLYVEQGKLVEAEKMYERALRGNEEAFGSNHISTLDTVNNLGSLYCSQGKLVEAEKMYKRALQGYKSALGDGTSQYYLPALDLFENLGDLYKLQGKPVEAQAMYTSALSGIQHVLGPSSERCTQLASRIHSLSVLQTQGQSRQQSAEHQEPT
ncbi:hypothetical protein yc1106_09280 [Curvularia clavata]|uniref:Heterokaryon incompatibility domain-containing protein n=1 Tax=Curvularia clavata TaxID=95742 RepID=A0A9Q8ZH72_CURCL|nr:hypothetical protein yc1106_09280 [Curvularia clavata]